MAIVLVAIFAPIVSLHVREGFRACLITLDSVFVYLSSSPQADCLSPETIRIRFSSIRLQFNCARVPVLYEDE